MKISAPEVERGAGCAENNERDRKDGGRKRRARVLKSSLAERVGCSRVNHSMSQFSLRSIVQMCSAAAKDLVELSRAGFRFVRRLDLNREVPNVELGTQLRLKTF